MLSAYIHSASREEASIKGNYIWALNQICMSLQQSDQATDNDMFRLYCDALFQETLAAVLWSILPFL